MDWYRIKTALLGVKRLATLSKEDKQACIDAYKFFQRMQAGEETPTEHETKAVADYYKVLNNMLSVFDLEKLYLPPQLDESKGLYGNPLLCEQAVLAPLQSWQSSQAARVRIGHLRRMFFLPGGLALLQEGGARWACKRDVPRLETRSAIRLFGVSADPPFRLEQRRACGASQSLPSNPGSHSLDVSGRRLCRVGKGRVQDPRLCPFEERSLADRRAEAQLDPHGAKAGSSPRGDSRSGSMGRRISRSSSKGWASLEGCRKGQDCRFELENRRGEALIEGVGASHGGFGFRALLLRALARVRFLRGRQSKSIGLRT